jgi:hypothetical protein
MASNREEADLAAHYANQARKRITGTLRARYAGPRGWRVAETSVPAHERKQIV